MFVLKKLDHRRYQRCITKEDHTSESQKRIIQVDQKNGSRKWIKEKSQKWYTKLDHKSESQKKITWEDQKLDNKNG